MSDRFSEPSNSLGVHRFHCWPAGADSYDHIELTQNWDKLDRIIGVPSSGAAWPPSEGVDGGIYAQFRILQHERVPIGAIAYWFRPTVDVPLTTITDLGWAVCDGSSLDDSDHDFPGIAAPVTLPDLLNTFVLGADPSKALGAAGVAATASSVNTRLGAPGPQGQGGRNEGQLRPHTHRLRSKLGKAILTGVAWTTLDPTFPGASIATVDLAPTLGDETQSAGDVPDNRPRYIGLIPIIKVKYVNTL